MVGFWVLGLLKSLNWKLDVLGGGEDGGYRRGSVEDSSCGGTYLLERCIRGSMGGLAVLH